MLISIASTLQSRERSPFRRARCWGSTTRSRPARDRRSPACRVEHRDVGDRERTERQPSRSMPIPRRSATTDRESPGTRAFSHPTSTRNPSRPSTNQHQIARGRPVTPGTGTHPLPSSSRQRLATPRRFPTTRLRPIRTRRDWLLAANDRTNGEDIPRGRRHMQSGASQTTIPIDYANTPKDDRLRNDDRSECRKLEVHQLR